MAEISTAESTIYRNKLIFPAASADKCKQHSWFYRWIKPHHNHPKDLHWHLQRKKMRKAGRPETPRKHSKKTLIWYVMTTPSKATDFSVNSFGCICFLSKISLTVIFFCYHQSIPTNKPAAPQIKCSIFGTFLKSQRKTVSNSTSNQFRIHVSFQIVAFSIWFVFAFNSLVCFEMLTCTGYLDRYRLSIIYIGKLCGNNDKSKDFLNIYLISLGILVGAAWQ